jgi:hypothetical protein
MKLIELRAACVGKNSVQIDTLIKSTDEYQATQHGDGGRFARDTYTAGILIARGDQFVHGKPTETANALWQAAEQGMAADGASGIADSGTVWTWVPSGPFKQPLQPGSDNSFVKFLDDFFGDGELELDTEAVTLNCWEAVIVGAIRGNVITNGSSLIQMYEKGHDAFNTQLVQALVSGSGRKYRPGQLLATPTCGDIVLFAGLNHVAIATGQHDNVGTEVLSFWPAPAIRANQFGRNGTRTPMLRTTIEAIGAWMVVNMPDDKPPKVRFGSPDWQQLNQF